MVTYRGYNTHVMYVAEGGTYGGGGTVDTAIGGKVRNFSPSLNNNLVRTQGLGEGRNATQALFGAFDVNGTIEWELADFTFLQFIVGAISGAGSTASPYELTEKDAYGASDIDSFCMEVGSNETTDDVDTYDGCVLTEVSISATEGDIITATANWVAQSVTSSTSATSYSADTQKPWMFWQGTVQYGASPSAVAKVTSFSLTINNNSQIYRALGSREIEQPELGIRQYDFTLTVKMTDTIATTFRDDFYGQANSPVDDPADAEPTTSLELRLDLTEGASSGDRNAEIYLDEVFINDISKPVSIGEGIVEMTINGYALQAGNSSKPFKWWTET